MYKQAYVFIQIYLHVHYLHKMHRVLDKGKHDICMQLHCCLLRHSLRESVAINPKGRWRGAVVINNGHHPATATLLPPTPTSQLTLSAAHLHSQPLDGLMKPVQILPAGLQSLHVFLHSCL